MCRATTPVSRPIFIPPGTVPGDFHLRVTTDGFYRNVSNIRDYNSVWQVQNLSLLGLVDIAHETPNANFGLTEGSTVTAFQGTTSYTNNAALSTREFYRVRVLQ